MSSPAVSRVNVLSSDASLGSEPESLSSIDSSSCCSCGLGLTAAASFAAELCQGIAVIERSIVARYKLRSPDAASLLAGRAFQSGPWVGGVALVGISSLVKFLENTSGSPLQNIYRITIYCQD
jgi:hypothetical protein